MATDQEDRALDALMAEWTTPAASRDLHERIVASARPVQRPARALWWAGAAGLGLAGALAGAVLAAVLTPVSMEQGGGDIAFAAGSTVFGDLDEGSES